MIFHFLHNMQIVENIVKKHMMRNYELEFEEFYQKYAVNFKDCYENIMKDCTVDCEDSFMAS